MTKVAGLFEGVGMFTRAALALGCELAWSVEIDDWNRALLERRYPDAIHCKDVREVGAGLPEVEGFVLGFPCQDISNAGRREGISGKRSGLWGEAARLIGIYEPKWVVIENVSALKHRGLNTVLDDLHKLGYDATWDCIPALAVGAPHIRDRIWIVATQTGTVVAPAMFPAWEHGSLPKELPRAGTMTAEGVFYGTPQAEVGACKRAVKRGRPLFPTPEASDGTGGRVSAEVGGQRPSGSKRSVTLATAVAHDTVPTPSARDWKDTGEGRMGRGQLPEAVRDERALYPTPMAADGDRMSEQGTRFYADGTDNPTLLGAARRADAEETWPTPCVADATGGRRTKGAARPDEGGLEKTVHQRELLPTPKASDHKGADLARDENRSGLRHSGDDLPTAVAKEEIFPTPAANDAGNSPESHIAQKLKNGARVGTSGKITSLEVLARNGFEDASEDQIAEAQRLVDGGLFPTPAANDHKGDVVSHLRNKHGWDGGERSRITSLEVLAKNDFQQASPEQIEEARSTPPAHGKRVETWPTPHGFAKEGQDRNPGPSGNELGRAVNQRTFPTPVASDAEQSRRHTTTTGVSHPGTTLFDAVLEDGLEVWPTPTSAQSGSSAKGPDFARAGRPGSGGDDLVTAVARTLPTPRASDGDPRNRGDLIAHVKERPNSHHPGERAEGRENERRPGALNPDWVEWLMGIPVGWTNPDCAEPVQLDWSSEYGVPRTAVDVPHRRARLTAIGNALVWKVATVPIKEAMDRAA